MGALHNYIYNIKNYGKDLRAKPLGIKMALLNQSIQIPAQIETVFKTLQQGQAPEKFSRQFLKDIGFSSSNYHALIPLLKGLGFISADGTPTQRYRDFLDPTNSKKIIAQAIKEAYGDIFIIKSHPTKSDKKIIAGKYKTQFNASEIAADRAAATFLALLDLADENILYNKPPDTDSQNQTKKEIHAPANKNQEEVNLETKDTTSKRHIPLHYNIQIHLPATKDLEVYNSIFKSLKEHLFD